MSKQSWSDIKHLKVRVKRKTDDQKLYLCLHSFSKLWKLMYFLKFPWKIVPDVIVSGATLDITNKAKSDYHSNIRIKGASPCGFKSLMSTANEQYNTLPDWYNTRDAQKPNSNNKTEKQTKNCEAISFLKNTNASCVILMYVPQDLKEGKRRRSQKRISKRNVVGGNAAKAKIFRWHLYT